MTAMRWYRCDASLASPETWLILLLLIIIIILFVYGCVSVRLCVDTSITVLAAAEADAGVYQCIANNVVGAVYATAVLTVTPSRHTYTSTMQSVATSPQPSCTCCLANFHVNVFVCCVV